jgi:signal transduction histidine kinase
VNRLSKATQKVASGDYDIYIGHSNRDEIDRLSADFNKMIKALSEWRREVLHLEDRRKTFMQDVAHEMRTPLTTINGLLEGMEYNVFDEEQEMRSIKIMRKETTRLIRLVNENLDYENIQSNRIVLKKHPFPLNDAMTEISEQLTPIAKDSHNEIIIEDNVDDITVYADFDRFKQIIVNLIKNALQFTTDGQILIDASETKEFTQITVSDTGIGMTTEQMENIWDRYYKADPSRKNTRHGESGLGLPIVKQLVELHEGNIEVESELGKGTKITVTLPRRKMKNISE